MNNYNHIITLLLCWYCITSLQAQGPPITGDKPIMLGSKRLVFKTLSEFRRSHKHWALKTPIMTHYLPTSNTLVGLYIPLVFTNISENHTAFLGDINVITKYQFYKKDGTGKTFRIVLKGVQNIPTGAALQLQGISTGVFQSFWSIIAGYESIKYGISSELGYNISVVPAMNEMRLKLGFGLPLLKPSYPVKQINLFFEYQSSYWHNVQEYMLLYAQGIQYAIGRFTIETAFQWPLLQQTHVEHKRLYSFYWGMRYVL